MAQSQSFAILQKPEPPPPCPTCGKPMCLMRRVSVFNTEHDLRTLECQVCGYVESTAAEFTQ